MKSTPSLTYVTKYTTKCEKKSEILKKVLPIILEKEDELEKSQVITKLLMSKIKDRDMSGQEVSCQWFEKELVATNVKYESI